MTLAITGTAVEEAASVFERSSGLDLNQAKTIVFWALTTNGLSELDIFPILSIQGPAGTGKTTTTLLAGKISHGFSGKILSGHMTPPRLRDSLTFERTVAIDESEGVDESLLINRYSRASSGLSVNKPKGARDWAGEDLDLFGATILNRRQPIRDQSVLSRAVVITTIKNDRFSAVNNGEVEKAVVPLLELVANIDWTEIPMGLGRIRDTWAPLLLVATACGDEDWLDWVEYEIAKVETIFELGQLNRPGFYGDSVC